MNDKPVFEDENLLQTEKELQEAARRNDTAMIRRLICIKVNVNAKNNDNRTALHWAVAGGNEDAVKLLLDHNANVDIEDKFGMTPALLAAWFGHLQLLQILVNAGAKVTIRNSIGQGIHHCAAHQGHMAIIRYTIEELQEVPLDKPDQTGKTPLLLAAENGQLDVVTYLHALGCDHQFQDKERNSCIHLAAGQGHVHVLENLIQGIFSESKNKAGQTALHLAAEGGHFNCVKLLLDNQCQINVRCSQNLNALHYAVKQGHKDVCHLLVEEGIDMNAVGQNACLHLAVKHNFAQLVRLLIAAGCDINISDHKQQSALHLAVERGQFAIVEMLLKANINLQLQDKQGKTALDLAVRSQHAVLIDMIIKMERFNARNLDTSQVAAEGQGDSVLGLPFNHVPNLSHVRSVLWNLATKHLKPGDWKKLAEHWDFSKKHIKAVETQWTGSNSYKEHGYRMLLIWLHGIITLGKHPIKELYESLVKIGKAEVAEKIRRQANTEMDSSQKCEVM
ncbi:ankyrin repeat and death domain-containing protein 1A-like isoform X3 [Rhincodon typus]|uniref:ankyrin repeat and death domain-containing protein 1A-like isoform X3 n=1 Tax=Rhincodon typus TaxID=259920 RepID=UPI00203049BA|nr:ankyrin repeat and death domain-containing protein 1A-like isoform X3 [Rhincodon typus]